jgi:hypothetical protein
VVICEETKIGEGMTNQKNWYDKMTSLKLAVLKSLEKIRVAVHEAGHAIVVATQGLRVSTWIRRMSQVRVQS